MFNFTCRSYLSPKSTSPFTYRIPNTPFSHSLCYVLKFRKGNCKNCDNIVSEICIFFCVCLWNYMKPISKFFLFLFFAARLGLGFERLITLDIFCTLLSCLFGFDKLITLDIFCIRLSCLFGFERLVIVDIFYILLSLDMTNWLHWIYFALYYRVFFFFLILLLFEFLFVCFCN